MPICQRGATIWATCRGYFDLLGCGRPSGDAPGFLVALFRCGVWNPGPAGEVGGRQQGEAGGHGLGAWVSEQGDSPQAPYP